MSIATIAKIILVMMLWAACFPLIAAGIEFAPHMTFAALRAFLAGVTLTLLAVALRRPLPKEPQIWAMVAIVGLGATTLGFVGMFHAAEFVSPGIATVILAALGITVSNVLIKRIAGKVDALMAMGLQMLIGSIPLALSAWTMEDPTSIRWSLTFVGAFLGLSLLGTALVYWLWFSVLEKTQLNRANAFSFLIPIFGLTMGFLFYDETLGWPQLVGIALTILGVGLVTRRGTRSLEVDT